MFTRTTRTPLALRRSTAPQRDLDGVMKHDA